MIKFCEIKKLFGKENEGIRKTIPIINLEYIDLVGAFVLALALHFLFKRELPFLAILISCFIIVFVFNTLFCIQNKIHDLFLFFKKDKKDKKN